MVYRETFLEIQQRLLQHLFRRSWIHGVQISEHTSTHLMSENKTPVQDQRCQSGPSATNSVIPVRENFQRIMEQTNNDCRSQISILTSSLHQQPTFACWRIRFKTEVCICSQFPTEAMQCIKEVDLVDSVDELRTSSSIRGISNGRFWSTRCEDCFSTEQNHP